ncbi:hypothetical protein VTO42DRAFT_4215 [Malbranchea cinnamomea]
MPRYLAPALSGVHRLACLSLYRALLAQCSRPWLSSEQARDTRLLIRRRFRNDKLLLSPSKITGSLNAGYEALDLLDACSQGDKYSISRFNALLAQTRPLLNRLSRGQSSNEKTPNKEPVEPARETSKQQYKPEPILSRPRPHVSGIRHVPRLVNARGIPFLRIKKPQPEVLSRTIRGKLVTRWKRIERRQRLEEELVVAQEEDMWDELTGQAERATFESTVKASLDEVNELIIKSDIDNQKLAKKMWEIVLKERELAEKEQAEREAKASVSAMAKDGACPKDLPADSPNM